MIAIISILATIIGVAGIWTFLGAVAAKAMGDTPLTDWQRRKEPLYWG
jgi:hypothetical protein